MSSEDTPASGPPQAPEVPVLRDVVTSAPDAVRSAARRVDRDVRAALGAEATFLVDEVLDEILPELEARLRERLEQRVREWLDAGT